MGTDFLFTFKVYSRTIAGKLFVEGKAGARRLGVLTAWLLELSRALFTGKDTISIVNSLHVGLIFLLEACLEGKTFCGSSFEKWSHFISMEAG